MALRQLVDCAGGMVADRPADRLVTEAARLLDRPRTPVDDVAARLGVGERQLLRRSRAAVGYGPATLRRVLRFRRFVSRVDAGEGGQDGSRRLGGGPGGLPGPDGPDLARLAADTGYADQAHLTRECVRLAGLPPAALAAQRRPAPGEQGRPAAQRRPATRGPAGWFTGEVWMDELATLPEPGLVRALRVHFTPGARTAWHVHPLGQVLHIVEGVGRVQGEGGPVRQVCPGDTVVVGPGRDTGTARPPTISCATSRSRTGTRPPASRRSGMSTSPTRTTELPPPATDQPSRPRPEQPSRPRPEQPPRRRA